MYSTEDFHRDVKRGISTIYVIADQLDLDVLAEEFIEECNHPDGEKYWRQVHKAVNHDQDKFRLMLINHFTEWTMCILELPVVPWPVTESRGPSLRRKYDEGELEVLTSPDPTTHSEAREERLSVAAAICESSGVAPIQFIPFAMTPLAIRGTTLVRLRAIKHDRVPMEIINEYIDESEHQEGFRYWFDNFYNESTHRFDYGAMVLDVIVYADIATEMSEDHPE